MGPPGARGWWLQRCIPEAPGRDIGPPGRATAGRCRHVGEPETRGDGADSQPCCRARGAAERLRERAAQDDRAGRARGGSRDYQPMGGVSGCEPVATLSCDACGDVLRVPLKLAARRHIGFVVLAFEPRTPWCCLAVGDDWF